MINVEWQDERGEVLGRYSGFVMADTVSRAQSSSTCVRFIDPYGDTTFNQSQLPVLIEEFQALASHVDDSDRKSIGDLLVFVRSAVGHVHTYIKFIGD